MALKGIVNIVTLQGASDLADGETQGIAFLQVCTRQTGQHESSLKRGVVNIKVPRKK